MSLQCDIILHKYRTVLGKNTLHAHMHAFSLRSLALLPMGCGPIQSFMDVVISHWACSANLSKVSHITEDNSTAGTMNLWGLAFKQMMMQKAQED